MPNVLLTQKCVRECPYCFAKKHMADSDMNDMMPWENLIYLADFFQQSHMDHMSLLGGEPTLHPYFIDFLLYLSKRGFKITVFTSGIMSTQKLQELYKAIDFIPSDNLNFVCNLNDPVLSPENEIKKVENFLELFSKDISLSFNIYHLDFDMNYIFDTIKKFNLKKHIRLGLAHPIQGEKNQFITPGSFIQLAEKLYSYFPLVKINNVSIGFDCGFVSCIFNDEQLGQFLRFEKNESKFIRFVCNPAIDIGPDLKIWSCFPLSNLIKKSIYDFDSLKDINDFFLKIHKKVRNSNHGIFSKCSNCNHLENEQCAGGCIAHIINNYNEVELNLLKDEAGG